MKEKKSSYFTATWKMLAAVIIGGIAGGVSAVIYELMKKGIDAGIRTINGTIQQYIFPTLIIIAVVTVVVGEYSLYRLKNVYKEMKDADEDRFYELDYEEEKWGAWTSGVNLAPEAARYWRRCNRQGNPRPEPPPPPKTRPAPSSGPAVHIPQNMYGIPASQLERAANRLCGVPAAHAQPPSKKAPSEALPLRQRGTVLRPEYGGCPPAASGPAEP